MEKTILIIAAIALTLHGLMEVMPLPFLLKSKPDSHSEVKGLPKFIFEPLRNNPRPTMALGIIFGFLRLVAVIGIVMNLMWGWALGVVISAITLIVMTFYLPVGIIDGILSGVTLISLLIAFWGSQPIL